MATKMSSTASCSYVPASSLRLRPKAPRQLNMTSSMARRVAGRGTLRVVAGEAGAVRRTLTSMGWEPMFVEGIVDRIGKKEVDATAQSALNVVNYLESLGLSQQSICSMATLCPPILSLNVDGQMRPVVEYLQGRGVEGETLATVLTTHPKLLSYTVEFLESSERVA